LNFSFCLSNKVLTCHSHWNCLLLDGEGAGYALLGKRFYDVLGNTQITKIQGFL